MGRAEDLFERINARGEAAIEEFIETRESEELFLDFKRSSDDGVGGRLSDIDRKNLAKAISGFGNSEGGVVVWGVDCSQGRDGADVAREKFPVADTSKYRSWLEGAVSGCTVPPHVGVRNVAIGRGQGSSGYVATLIPQSNAAPHQVVGRMIYYIRAGSNFVPVPHGVLAGMFGRRPQSDVIHQYLMTPAEVQQGAIHCSLGICLRNLGPGIATDLFVNLLTLSVPWADLEFDQSGAPDWTGTWSLGRIMSLISPPGFRLAPEAHVQPVVLKMRIAPPFGRPLEIKGMVGCANGPPKRFRIFNTAESVSEIYEGLTERVAAGEDVSKEVHALTSLLGLEDDLADD